LIVAVQTTDGYELAPPPSHILELVDILENLGEVEKAEAFAVPFSESFLIATKSNLFLLLLCRNLSGEGRL